MSKADGADLQDLARLRLGPVTAIFALMVTTQAALDELNLSGTTVTEAELQRASRGCGIETSNAGERLRCEIKAFYDARKDRRIGKGYSDNGNNAH